MNGGYDDLDDYLEYDDYGGGKFDLAFSVTPIPIAILYTNRQLYFEVSRVLYRSNWFTLDVSVKVAVRFLKNLQPALRLHIKHLNFIRAVTAVDDADCTEFWQPLYDFISQHMQITSVTIQLPRDQNHEIDESKESYPSPHGEWFWWPAVENLTKMLMDGKIQRLRLAFTVTYLRRGGDEDPEGFDAIGNLRTPWSWWGKRAREYQERCEYEAARRDGLPHKFDSVKALHEDQSKRRQRLDFVVSREDNSVGDIGTVLELTRPHKLSEEASAK